MKIISWGSPGLNNHTELERDRQTDRQNSNERETERDRERQTENSNERQTDRQTETETKEKDVCLVSLSFFMHKQISIFIATC